MEGTADGTFSPRSRTDSREASRLTRLLGTVLSVFVLALLAFLLLFLPLPLLRRVLAPLSGAPARVDAAARPPDTARPWKSSSSK